MEKIEEVKSLIKSLLDEYGDRIERIDPLATIEFFEKLEAGLRNFGAEIVDRYWAPNGHVIFVLDGEEWTFDLLFGLYRR